MIHRFTALALSSMFVAATASAQHLCWIQRVQAVDDEVRIFLRPAYRCAIRSILRSDATREPFNGCDLEFFALKEGEKAFLMGGAHDQCDVAALRRDGKLGAQVDALSRPNGMPASTASAFVAGTE